MSQTARDIMTSPARTVSPGTSIQDLANEALYQTENLASGLKEITYYAELLGGGDVRGSLDKSNDVSQLTADADTILADLHIQNSLLSSQLGCIERTSGTLAVDIAATAATIRIHDDVNDILKHSIEDLMVITDQYPTAADTWEKVQHIPLFKEMHNRYSMKSERDIHLRVLRQDGKATTGADGEKADSSNAGTSHDLGNNIELF